MRVPACTPKRGHSPGNATAVLKGLVSSAQERAKIVAFQVRTEDSRLETLLSLVEALDPPAHGRN